MTNLNRREILACLPVATCALAFPASARIWSADDPVSELVTAFVREKKSDGLSVAVIRAGRTRFHNAGIIDRKTGTRASRASVYEIGSISKTFTALLLARAIGEGRARLSDDVRRHLPPGYDNLVVGGRAVTLGDIVTTTSALPDNLPDPRKSLGNAKPGEVPFVIARQLEAYTKPALLADLAKAELVGVPGAVPRHSNLASQLLGIMLERIYGQPYETLLAQYIEKPLGMHAGSGLIPPGLLAQGYGAEGAETPSLTQPVARAAAGLRYSAADMARYLAAQIAARDPAIAMTQRPLWGSPDAGAIGFHWNIAKTPDSQLYLRHSGGTFGFSSYCDFYPGQRYGIVLLANRSGLQDALQQVADAAHEALFGPPRGLTALQAALDASDYADVAKTVSEVRRRHPDLHLSEDFVNLWGYRLLGASQLPAARAILGYNLKVHPESWNAHDSYAEVLAASGDTTGAIAEYRRSLALNPANDNADRMIAKLLAAPGQ